MDTLVLSYVLGTIYPHLGLSPFRLRPCWAHMKIKRYQHYTDTFLY
jgi:hypothetical protein